MPRDEVTVHVSAPPNEVWELVTAVERMGEWSPENTGARWRDGARVAAVGARFTGFNRHGRIRWSTHCRVLVCDAPREFVFHVRESDTRWGFRLEPTDLGTSLTQWRERGTAPWYARLLTASGILGRDREHSVPAGMRVTLDRIRATAECRAA